MKLSYIFEGFNILKRPLKMVIFFLFILIVPRLLIMGIFFNTFDLSWIQKEYKIWLWQFVVMIIIIMQWEITLLIKYKNIKKKGMKIDGIISSIGIAKETSIILWKQIFYKIGLTKWAQMSVEINNQLYIISYIEINGAEKRLEEQYQYNQMIKNIELYLYKDEVYADLKTVNQCKENIA